MTDDLDVRRRRALWRASHRGTRELDLLLGGFAEAKIGTMSESELRQFEEFLAGDEARLQSWLLAPDPGECEAFPEIVSAVREFYGLKPCA